MGEPLDPETELGIQLYIAVFLELFRANIHAGNGRVVTVLRDLALHGHGPAVAKITQYAIQGEMLHLPPETAETISTHTIFGVLIRSTAGCHLAIDAPGALTNAHTNNPDADIAHALTAIGYGPDRYTFHPHHTDGPIELFSLTPLD